MRKPNPKGIKSPFESDKEEEFVTPDLSRLENQYVSDTDTSHDIRSKPPIVDERTKLEKLAEEEEKNRGKITRTKGDRMGIEATKRNPVATLFTGR